MAETDRADSDYSVEQNDEIKTKVEIDVDSGEGDDYSSGSDRSFEAEDADNCDNRGDADLETVSNSLLFMAERRKRRHGSHGSRRHKGGSRHKNRGFHPYLDPKEELQLKRKSQEIKEKENAAAVVRQEGESRFMNFPVAPFNSTQFLMDEHDSGSPAGMHKTDSFAKFSEDSELLHSLASTPAESQHEMVNLERKDKEFTDIYTTVHAESLQSLPKDELVKNYMNLEEKVAALQKKVAEAEQQKKQDDDSGESKFQESQDEIMGDSGSDSTFGKCEVGITSLTSNDLINRTTQAVNHPLISVGDIKSPSAPVPGSCDISS